MMLYINCCVRAESRTERLAGHLLGCLREPAEEIRLIDVDFPKADAGFIAKRDRYIAEGDFSDPMFDLAKQFAQADTIVIAAPFWDLSFPAVLKQYFEQINVSGITFRYNEQGIPQGLCRAKKLYYVTTAGGQIFNDEYGYGYVRALAEGFYGIQEVVFIKAENLDIDGSDAEEILRTAIESMDSLEVC